MLQRLGSFFLDILQIIAFAVGIFVFVYFLILQPHKIKGNSMEPNFSDGEFLLTNKLNYRFRDPKRGDVIIFKAPPDDRDEYIKRIIGLPNEKISLKRGFVYVNGEKLGEPYLGPDPITFGGQYLSEGENLTVPEDSYFVLGDNRPHSSDSRTWGFIKKEKITGLAWFVYWPVPRVGLVKAIEYVY